MIERIQWLGHGSFRLQGSPLIYINPWRVARSVFHADIILITHDHYDHCSLADIDKLRGPHTLVIGNERVASEIGDCTVIRPWQSLTIDRACIKAIPAYSLDEWQHPKSDGGLGFVLSINRYDIYYAGDTQFIPEMNNLKPDIAIVPINGHGTMTVEEASEAVRQMKPRWAIPSNWGSTSEGATRLDALAFKSALQDQVDVVLLPQM
jgi:L-ascorbate metabolism protein UlaG (beta-lactamase superfamily)